MWCSTCAKSIRESVAQIDGVGSADLNYTSKLLLVKLKSGTDRSPLDTFIQTKVAQIGFGIKKQSEGWILNFHENLKREAHRKIPWVLISLVWFLAMWSSMLAFAAYSGGDLSSDELHILAMASSAFGLPAILLGVIPFGRAGLRAFWFSRLLTLDLFIFLGGLSAVAISLLSLFSQAHITYADSGSMIVAVLLLAKKIENTLTNELTHNILFQLHPKNTGIKVFRKNQWVTAEVSQVKRNDLVQIEPGETIPLDGLLRSETAEINNHLINGESRPTQFKKGDHILAGAIAKHGLELIVTAPQGERKIDAWAETALLSENNKSRYTKLFSKIESGLVIFAFGGALLISLFQALRGAEMRLVLESFFVGILIFCPCLFASIIPLMKQMAHLSLLKRGVMLSRTEALLDLPEVQNFYFDKTGTLEAVESEYSPLDINDESATPYLKALADMSIHPIFRGLKLDGKQNSIQKMREHPGKGVEAQAIDGTRILVGKGSFLIEKGIREVKESPYPYVSLNEKIVGQILSKSIYDSNSLKLLEKLLSLYRNAKIEILSGDPLPRSGDPFTKIDDRISYHGNLAPEEKAQRLQKNSVFVGDGLNDTLALAKARVSFRLGHRVLGFAPVDFHLQSPNLELVLTAIQYAKKYRKVLIQTGSAAFLYNISALVLAGLGMFSPLGAVLSMFGSFSVMLLSVFRLSNVKEVRL